MASAGDDSRASERPATDSYQDEWVAHLVDGALLDRVIDETVRAESFADAAGDVGLLLDVAHRYPQAAFTVDPIAVAILQAVLGPSYRKFLASDDAWQVMTQAIAQALCDDPRSRERLERLWHRLQEAQP